MTCAALIPPGTATQNTAVATARLAAPLSLRTAKHDIGIDGGLPTDSGRFTLPKSYRVAGPAATAGPVLPPAGSRPVPWRPASADIVDGAMAYTIRSARTSDVPVVRKLIDSDVESGRLLSKATVTLYEDVQEFVVAELDADATVGGCGALHVMWEDLAEIRTVAVRDDCRGLGSATALSARCWNGPARSG